MVKAHLTGIYICHTINILSLDDEISNGQSLLPFVLVPKFYPDILFLLYFFLFRSQISIFSYYYKLSILKIVLYTLRLQNAHNQNV